MASKIDSSYDRLNTVKTPSGSFLFYDVFRKNDIIVCIGPYYATKNVNALNIEVEGETVEPVFVPDNQCHTCIYTFNIPSSCLEKQAINFTLVNDGARYDLELVKGPEKTYLCSVSALMKNEHSVIEEWIKHHLSFGVQHIYLYDNNSRDRDQLDKLIAPYESSITLIYWDFPYHAYIPERHPLLLDSHYYCQIPQLNHANWKYGYQSTWILNLDLDEFLTSERFTNVIDFANCILSPCANDSAGIHIRYGWFGSYGVGRDKFPLLDNYIKRHKDYSNNIYCSGKVFCNTKNTLFREVHNTPGTPSFPLRIVEPSLMRANHYKLSNDTQDYSDVLDFSILNLKYKQDFKVSKFISFDDWNTERLKFSDFILCKIEENTDPFSALFLLARFIDLSINLSRKLIVNYKFKDIIVNDNCQCVSREEFDQLAKDHPRNIAGSIGSSVQNKDFVSRFFSPGNEITQHLERFKNIVNEKKIKVHGLYLDFNTITEEKIKKINSYMGKLESSDNWLLVCSYNDEKAKTLPFENKVMYGIFDPETLTFVLSNCEQVICYNDQCIVTLASQVLKENSVYV